MTPQAIGLLLRHLSWLLVALWVMGLPARARAELVPSAAEGGGVSAIASAITELDVELAKALIERMRGDSPGLALQRARLAIYVGDCDTAEAILGAVAPSVETQQLAELARTCARATAGATVVEDSARGVWLRFQDSRDEVLAEPLAAVAVAARETLQRDLGITLPRPLRIDLVRDLYSLASVSGLPVEAAETTGTVAVARWGRVTMLSPRAALHGYPWQDTLAHEITHLVLSRGSGDFAPLWLQEGVAKREETRWRPARPFDEERVADDIARNALLQGTSVGVDRIGPSIAMLPTPEAAGISYAEVESFMGYWIARNGRAALTLLLADLRGLATRDANLAMQAVTGYPLAFWIVEWQRHLLSAPDKPPSVEEVPEAHAAKRPVIQSVRLGDLLREAEQAELALSYYDDASRSAPRIPAVRYRVAALAMALARSEVDERLGTIDEVERLHGAWLGLRGRLAQERGAPSEGLLELAIAVDPLGEAAACEGHSQDTRSLVSMPVADAGASQDSAPNERADGPLSLPADPVRRKLCNAARRRLDD